MKMRSRAAATAVLALTAALGLSACSGAIVGNQTAADSKVKTIQSGVLTVGLSPDFPPMEYLNPSDDKLVGVDVDLVTELSKRLGLKVNFVQQKFDQLISSVRTNRVDIVFSGMSDTVDRQKTLDFIDYFNSQGRFYTTASHAKEFTKDTDACGTSVAVSSVTDYYPALQHFSKTVCVDAGHPAVNIVATDSGAAARLQLDQGRALLAIQGAENLVYFNKQSPGKYPEVLSPVNQTPYGAAFAKGNTALENKVLAQLKAMVDDGTMKKILETGGVAYGLRAPAINGVK